jgi:hypothetical protein
VRPSETATVGHAQKFVGSRNPVTLIVNIEILTGDAHMDTARRSSRAIYYRRGSGGATFVPMMQSTDLGKCDDLAS